MEPINPLQLQAIVRFFPGDKAYTIWEGYIHRVTITSVEVRLDIQKPFSVLYRYEDSRGRLMAGTEVFAKKTDLVDWLMHNVQNEGAS